MRHKLPTRIIVFLVLLLLFTFWQIVRFATALAWSDTLGNYEPALMPIYISASGAFWALTGLFLLWSMWRGERWTRVAFIIAFSVYAAWVWMDRFFVQAEVRANWLFDLVLTVVFLIYTFIVVLDPHNKIYFERETYERES
jgi:hypothetical protein